MPLNGTVPNLIRDMPPSNPPTIIAIGPAEFQVCITPGPRLAPYHIGILEAYSKALVEALQLQRDDEIHRLQLALKCSKKPLWVFTLALEFRLKTAQTPPAPPPDSDGLKKILRILTSSDCAPPESVSERNEWCTKIIELAWNLTQEELRSLKKRCPTAVWTALVFTRIRPTPAHLFPVAMEPACLNCVKKGHPCMFQNRKTSKCRECSLFGIACPKGQPGIGKRKLDHDDERVRKRARHDSNMTVEEEIVELKAQIVQLQEQVGGMKEVLVKSEASQRFAKDLLWEIFDTLVERIKRFRQG
ncbi:uncharacterized protein EV420DRAFT_1633731 [Desarmillaria tabescens]|uniref:Zn(2)-C6 fungal-type domain-containing protein n=1 Tax=Armillaria tabescens TaxID=1929756 RepID=A0AA39T784_ARMTA|nr:uncharacterized protein EV420DRAFT_1633731 [Desarmillaria tabescens]KAK0469316.1 hypothetical protein EV420DRAFT_1633731 [Desarmillaria tabescens]